MNGLSSAEEPHQRRVLPRRRRWLFRLAAAGVPSILGLVLLAAILVWQERLARDPATGWWKLQSPPIYLFEPGHEVTGQVALYDARLGWRNIPKSSTTTFGRPLTINSMGHRGPEYTLEKPADVSRILLLGDSYTWGYGVGDDEVFAALLRQKLQASVTKWQVLNSGVSGWGTDQELLYLDSEGFRFSPQLVVLALFVGNDPSENMFSIRYGLQKPVFLDTRLTLANVPVPKPGENVPNQQSSAKPGELTIAIVKRIQEVCQAQSCPLVVMKFGSILLPRGPALADPVMQEVVREIGQLEKGLPRLIGPLYFDLDRRLAAAQLSGAQLVRGDDHHWNELGHRVTAEFLYEFLVKKQLVREEVKDQKPGSK